MASITSSKNKKAQKPSNFSYYLIGFGFALIFGALLIFFLTFFPIIKEEAKYALRGTNSTNSRPIKPTDTNFGIVIPKIQANAKIIDKVDPFNSQAYQIALTKGVAHALGTAYPGQPGNDFIFAHSSENWYEANRYNSVFYLVHKLEKNDEIDVYFQKKKFIYRVVDKIIVDPSDVSYLKNSPANSILTLMTCWPPGTSLKRLIVRAKPVVK